MRNWLYGYHITCHPNRLHSWNNAYRKGTKAFLVHATVAFSLLIHAFGTYSCLRKLSGLGQVKLEPMVLIKRCSYVGPKCFDDKICLVQHSSLASRKSTEDGGSFEFWSFFPCRPGLVSLNGCCTFCSWITEYVRTQLGVVHFFFFFSFLHV